MSEANKNNYDLIVIGGGSAGMAAAIYAAKFGKRVKVFDASGPNFDKPCGEGLMPPAIQALRQLGVEIPESCLLSGVKYFSNSGHSAYAGFANARSAMGIRRRILRQSMWKRATDLGVIIEQTSADRLAVGPNQIRVNDDFGAYLCVASGTNSRVLKQLGLNSTGRKKSKNQRFGLRRHLNVTPWSDCVEVYWRDYCELYVTPVSKTCVNIAILSWKPFQFEEILKLFPEVVSKISNAPWDDEASGRAPLFHRSSRVQAGRVLVTGDAAMFLDAMTGEGNTLAIRSGMAAARSIVNGHPHLYRWYWLQVVWRYWLVTAPFLRASRGSWMRMHILNTLIKFPQLLRAGIAFLSSEPRIREEKL